MAGRGLGSGGLGMAGPLHDPGHVPCHPQTVEEPERGARGRGDLDRESMAVVPVHVHHGGNDAGDERPHGHDGTDTDQQQLEQCHYGSHKGRVGEDDSPIAHPGTDEPHQQREVEDDHGEETDDPQHDVPTAALDDSAEHIPDVCQIVVRPPGREDMGAEANNAGQTEYEAGHGQRQAQEAPQKERRWQAGTHHLPQEDDFVRKEPDRQTGRQAGQGVRGRTPRTTQVVHELLLTRESV